MLMALPFSQVSTASHEEVFTQHLDPTVGKENPEGKTSTASLSVALW